MLQATHSARTPLKRHTTEIRVGAGGYATMADAISYVNSLSTLDTQHRVRLLVDNGTYNESFILPQYCDLQGESKAGVIFLHNEGDGLIAYDNGSPVFLAFYTDSLVKDVTVDVTNTASFLAGVGLLNGEDLVTGLYDNLLIDADQAWIAMLMCTQGISSALKIVDHYLSLQIKNTEMISGGNNVFGSGSSTDQFVGSLNFDTCTLTGGEQMQGGSPFQTGFSYVECWGVFFGFNFGLKTSHRIRPECNFIDSSVKQYDPPWVTIGLQAYNMEYSYYTGGQSNCINSTFETVRDSPADGKHGTPLFYSGFAQDNLTVNPNAKFVLYTDGCTFTKNSTFVPSGDIRWYDGSSGDQKEDTAPIITWGGTGTNPTLVKTPGE